MKKRLALLLSLLLMLLQGFSASASMKMEHRAYVGTAGKEASILMSFKTQKGHTYRLCNESGTIMYEGKIGYGEGLLTAKIPLPADQPINDMLYLYVDDEETPSGSALLAASQPDNEAAIVRVDRDDKKIAITFDAANAASHTLELLDLLDEYNAKCTFFVIGRFVQGNPEITREIEARGHEMAGHSYDHPEMPAINNTAILSDFEKTSAQFETVLGHDVTLYRPPSGYSTIRDRTIARALGQEVIQWTVDSYDSFSFSTYYSIVYRMKEFVGSGDIILMHVYGTHTINALKTMLPYYTNLGYELVTVSDLLLKGDTYIDADGVQRLRTK